MTWGEGSALVTAFATLIAAVGSLVVSLLSLSKIEAVHIATNSMKDELVAVTAKSSRAEGVKEERDRNIEKAG